MTVMATPRVGDTWSVGAPRLLAGDGPLDLDRHLAVHGPLAAFVPGEAHRLIGLLDRVGLTGRGGAGFPLAAKLRALRPGARPAIVVNGCESEPASHKDRTLLRNKPHLVLDGAAVMADALDAHRVVVTVADPAAYAAVRNALAERPDGRRFRLADAPDRFVAGEARAVLRRLDGGRAVPPGRRTWPTDRGLGGAPTVVSNVETYAQLAVLVRLGAADFARTGTAAEPGTSLITVTGAVGRPGVVEIPTGTPLGVVLAAAGAAPVQGLVIGGYHGAWLAADPALPLSRAALQAAGGTFGAGVVAVVGPDTCGLGELARVAEWLAAQSAGQCGPCRFGLPALAADVRAAWAGDPAALGRAVEHAHAVDRRGACAHPDGAARFVTTGLRVLGAELATHVQHGGCGRPVLGQLPLGGAS